MDITQLDAAWRLAIAALVGLGVGLEREWSGHASGPDARFAGIRTFSLLGVLGGSGGLLLYVGHTIAGAFVCASGAALAVSAYVMAVRREGAEADGTTEAAALLVVALGAVAGIGWLGLAAGTGALTVFLLSEKTRVHWFVRKVEERELRATLQFAVLALVVLPALPAGPFLGELDIRPRMLWALVLVFSGLSFVGYISRRAIGAERGYGVTGALGGLISSTGVTLTFSRHSRDEPALSASLARGVLAACTVMVVRVAVVAAVLAPPVGAALWPRLAAPALVGGLILRLSWKREPGGGEKAATESGNPLRLASAIKMGALFQGGMMLLVLVKALAGTPGLYVSGALLGLADIDALTVSMTRPGAAADAELAARVIAIGVLADTVLKLGMSVAIGSPQFRRSAAPGLAALAVACAVGLWIV
jgi:uncharacterized membrane protein (DUF4010 family)